jgi:hypothetical protein
LFFAKKIPEADWEDFLLFMGYFEGVLEKLRIRSGISLVRLWWIDGETWCFGRVFLGGRKYANF